MASQDSNQEVLIQILQKPEAEPKQLPLQLLEDITKDFSDQNIIGRGTFGVVYKGSLQDGSKVAVKKLIPIYNSITESIDNFDKEFNAEVDCLKKVKHRNIVGFLGYCADMKVIVAQYDGKEVPAEQHERLLCFEYVPNGSLQDQIKDNKLHGLEWKKCYEIIMGVCLGLDYLHTKRSIFHLDLKPDNILLDTNMVPKITDFGLSRLFSDKSMISTMRAAGTLGYMAPEIFQGKISRKADVYSLGVIIIELLTGSKEPPSIETVHKKWRHKFSSQWNRNDDIFEKSYNQISVCTEIALMSVQHKPEDRPTISQILQILMTHGSFQTTLKEDVPALEFMDPHSTGAMFNDDEQPIAPASNEGRPAAGFNDGGRVLVKANHSKAAALEATTVRVQLEVTSSSSGRAPLDLVVVLDVSSSMCDGGGKLDQFKSAIDFVVSRLSPMDRLSIVTFSDVAKKVSPLLVMSKLGKFYVMGIVDGLVTSASGDANIKAGLETAQEVLAGRQYIASRAGHIILLMSDGHHQNAMQMSNNPCNFPIHTCVLDANTTSSTILQLTSGLLKAAVEDLHLILSKPKSRGHDLDRIVKVASDNSSRQETNRRSGTVTIKFGDLLGGQVRKADAELLLFKADGSEADILDVSVSYPSSQGIRQTFKVQTLRIKRSDACHQPGAADDLITPL